jgi:hypothetical protein
LPKLNEPKDEGDRFTATTGDCQQSGQSGESIRVIGCGVQGFTPGDFGFGEPCESLLQDLCGFEGCLEAAGGPGRDSEEMFRGGKRLSEPQFSATGDPVGFGGRWLLTEDLASSFECCGVVAAAQLFFSNGKQICGGRGQEPQNDCYQRGNGRQRDGRENESRSAAGAGGTD